MSIKIFGKLSSKIGTGCKENAIVGEVSVHGVTERIGDLNGR